MTSVPESPVRVRFSSLEHSELNDGQLLDRFVMDRDESAFEALVRRHGPMVLGVCRRMLRDPHDAEDAFQATFLVLARKGETILPRDMVGNWLYGVACRVANKARSMRERRRTRERVMDILPEEGHWPNEDLLDLSSVIDEELSRLPDKYRAPVVLCDLEGKTHREASEQLGWPEGTLSGRLSRARRMLARRLERRGLMPEMGQHRPYKQQTVSYPQMQASVPVALLLSTTELVSGSPSPQVLALGKTMIRVEFIRRGVLSGTAIVSWLVVALVLAGGLGRSGEQDWGSRAAGAAIPCCFQRPLLRSQ